MAYVNDARRGREEDDKREETRQSCMWRSCERRRAGEADTKSSPTKRRASERASDPRTQAMAVGRWPRAAGGRSRSCATLSVTHFAFAAARPVEEERD